MNVWSKILTGSRARGRRLTRRHHQSHDHTRCPTLHCDKPPVFHGSRYHPPVSQLQQQTHHTHIITHTDVRHTSQTHIWRQTSAHVGGCARRLRQRSSPHAPRVLPSATEPSRRLLHLFGTVCRRQYVHRRHYQFSAED